MKDYIKVECVLCRKEKDCPRQTYSALEIYSWAQKGVCPDCVSIWEVGKKTMVATKVDGKDAEAKVYINVPTDPKMGEPKGPIEVRGKDIMTAMGGVSLRGTKMGEKWFGGKRNIIDISAPQDDRDHYYISGGGDLSFKVPKTRAEAMKRVIIAFYNAIAKARVDGFDEGRNLLAALSKGDLSLESFDVQCDNARAGKKPRKRMDD